MFIDMANLWGAAKELGVRIDYLKLRDYFAGRVRLVRAYTYVPENGNLGIEGGLIGLMRRNGFRVITSTRTNLDVDLAVDMLSLAEHVDEAILVSGDGDFTRLVEAVQDKGVKVTVVGWKKRTAHTLIEAADEFVDLKDILKDIAWQEEQAIAA
jgi:uncharacterized LabA/DUF88 family protein